MRNDSSKMMKIEEASNIEEAPVLDDPKGKENESKIINSKKRGAGTQKDSDQMQAEKDLAIDPVPGTSTPNRLASWRKIVDSALASSTSSGTFVNKMEKINNLVAQSDDTSRQLMQEVNGTWIVLLTDINDRLVKQIETQKSLDRYMDGMLDQIKTIKESVLEASDKNTDELMEEQPNSIPIRQGDSYHVIPNLEETAGAASSFVSSEESLLVIEDNEKQE